jgi:hypothetical protein
LLQQTFNLSNKPLLNVVHRAESHLHDKLMDGLLKPAVAHTSTLTW